jgi:hypothetical protein
MAQSEKKGRGRPLSTLQDRIDKGKIEADWDKKVIALAQDGASDVEIRLYLDISDDLWYRWLKDEPQFSRTIKKARMHCQVYWERLGRNMATGEISGNAASWVFNMKNRFKWTDRVEQDNLSSDGSHKPVKIKLVGVAAIDRTD